MTRLCHGPGFDYNDHVARPAQNADEVAHLAESMIVYTHPDCTYSEALKDELREAGTVYEEINLALKPDQWPKVEELTGGERITPVTVQGDRATRYPSASTESAEASRTSGAVRPGKADCYPFGSATNSRIAALDDRKLVLRRPGIRDAPGVRGGPPAAQYRGGHLAPSLKVTRRGEGLAVPAKYIAVSDVQPLR